MAHRVPSCFRSSSQFLRPHQLIGVPRRASCFLRLIVGCLRLSLQRFQLDLRPNADACRGLAGPFGSAPRWKNQCAPVERFLLCNCALPWPGLVFWSSLPSGCERIADVSSECESVGILVHPRGTRPGNGDYGCSGETLQRNRSPVDRRAALVFWLALEFRRHRLGQPSLFCDVLFYLPQSERRQRTVSSRASVHSPRWRSTGRSSESSERRFARLSLEAAKSLRARAGMGRVQLHVLSPANVAPQLSFRFPSHGLVPLCFLHQRT